MRCLQSTFQSSWEDIHVQLLLPPPTPIRFAGEGVGGSLSNYFTSPPLQICPPPPGPTFICTQHMYTCRSSSKSFTARDLPLPAPTQTPYPDPLPRPPTQAPYPPPGVPLICSCLYTGPLHTHTTHTPAHRHMHTCTPAHTHTPARCKHTHTCTFR